MVNNVNRLTIIKCPEGNEEWFLEQYKLVVDSTRVKATVLNVYITCPLGHRFNLKTAAQKLLYTADEVNAILIQAQISIDKARGR